MKIVIKVALILAIVACGLSLYFGNQLDTMKKTHLGRIAFLTGELGTTSNKLVKTEKSLAETNAILVATQDALDKTNAVLQATQVTLLESQRETKAVKDELQTTKTELDTTKTELASSKETVQKINDALKQMGIADVSDIDAMTKKMVNQTEELKILGDQLEKMSVEKAGLEAKITELTTTPVNLRGQVVGVRNDWGFCVLNLGKGDRVQTNTQFLVYRDTKFVGKVQVSEVNSTTSIAALLPEYTRAKLLPGDLVVH